MREIKFRYLDYMDKFVYLTLDEIADLGILSDRNRGQYTGLKDKNGVEIYEGDILDSIFNLKSSSRIVEFDYYWLSRLECFQDVIKVIGNIYDNPELLNNV